MERDFMGLNSKDCVVAIKEEAVDGGLDSCSQVFYKASAVHWSSATKVSALPHFMSINISQEEKLPRMVTDPLASPRFDSSHKRHPDEIKGVPISLNTAFLKTHFAGQGQNFVGATMKQQFLGGSPVDATHGVLHSSGSIARTIEPCRYNAKASGAPAQLTIFYAGTVNVYNDISPEKAQATMLLAGNGSTAASNMEQATVQVQASNSKQAAGDGAFVNQPVIPASCSGLSSPMSISSHPVCQSDGGFSNNEMIVVKTNGISTTPSNVEPLKMVNSVGTVPPSTMIPSAIPQARKASLARFLEKRKERMMNSSPYNLTKKNSECSTSIQVGLTSLQLLA